MQQLVIASNNEGKIKEFRSLLHDINLLSLRNISFTQDIPEPYNTFEENAHIKAFTIHNFSGKNVFSDDSGLCVHALNGAPGVISAHYSGHRDDEANLQKVLRELGDKVDRRAYYKAVICLIWNGQTHYFEGICNGSITTAPIGNDGFGYDPIFIPDGYAQTFGQLPLDIKNKISHRGRAIEKMVLFLKDQVQL